MPERAVYSAQKRTVWLERLPRATRGARAVAAPADRRSRAAARRSRGEAGAGREDPSDHSQAEHRSGAGYGAHGPGGGDRGRRSPLPNTTAVLELLRPGNRDAFLVGLGTRQARQWQHVVDRSRSAACRGREIQCSRRLFKGAATTVITKHGRSSAPRGPTSGCSRPASSRTWPSSRWRVASRRSCRRCGSTRRSTTRSVKPRRSSSCRSLMRARRTTARSSGRRISAETRFEGDHPACVLVSSTRRKDPQGRLRPLGAPTEAMAHRGPIRRMVPRLSGAHDERLQIRALHPTSATDIDGAHVRPAA